MNENIKEVILTRTNRAPTQTVLQTPRWVFVVVALLILLLGVLSFIAWNFYSKAKQNDTPILTDDKATIIQNIGNHVTLPVGEEPVFATVTDPLKLADQPFFLSAETGDKVLVFPKAKKAILYRPSTDRIIEMMPIDLGATAF